jgi:hypothetical protein
MDDCPCVSRGWRASHPVGTTVTISDSFAARVFAAKEVESTATVSTSTAAAASSSPDSIRQPTSLVVLRNPTTMMHRVLALLLSVAFVTTNGQETNLNIDAVVSRDITPITLDFTGDNKAGPCGSNWPAICQNCCPTTGGGNEACTTWRNTGINWDNESTNSFWSLFGAFNSDSICKDLSTRAGQRIDEEMRDKCNIQRNKCKVIDRGDFNSAANIRNCDEPRCVFFFLWCSIECTQISCIYNLDCDPVN